MIISDAGLAIIKEFEGFRSRPYLDEAQIPTIGYGATYYPDSGRAVALSDPPLTEPQAHALLVAMVARYGDAIGRYVQVPLSQNEADALISWAYNVGMEAARTSLLIRKLNTGNYVGAADELPRWNRVRGSVDKILVRRRARERAIFLGERI